MNSSEIPSSVDERWTAYMDGKLAGADAAAFEREHPEAVVERERHSNIVRAIRTHSPAPELRNADFFNECILREISPPPAEPPGREVQLWSLWRLATAGALCLIAVGAIYAMFVRGHDQREEHYVAQVLSVRAGDSELDATVLDADGLTVVWIDGLDHLPNDYALQ
jgi:hypothetical protein